MPPDGTGAPAASGEAGTTAAAVETQPTLTPQPGAGEAAGTQPGATGVEAGDGTLPDGVHPAVREERERAKHYRTLAAEAYVFDDQGNVIGIRQDFAERVAQQLGEGRGAGAGEAAGGADADARLERVVQAFADQYGLLPDQVRGFIRLADHIAQERANEANAPFIENTLDQMTASLIASGDVPKEAAPFITKWVAEARAANPRAAMSARGRETILRQALGEYALNVIRRRRGVGTRPPSPAGTTPTLLRPAPGVGGAGITAEEAQVRAKLGLATDKRLDVPGEGVV